MQVDDHPADEEAGSQRLAILLAMAMFVLVVDTSLMNVSIAAVVHDLHTTVSSVQSAIALEALVSAAFILIGSKVGDLIGRKRAYIIGLLGYATGALAMTVAQSVAVIIVFWAVVGGIGASLLLPAMQSLIHGNFQGAAQKRAYALVGAAAAIAAAVGPLLGGFITTYLSWRLGFLLEDVIIAVVLLNIRLVKDVPYTGPRSVDVVGAAPVRGGDGRHRPGHPGVAGGRRSRRGAAGHGCGRARRARVLARAAQARGQGDVDRPRPVQGEGVPVRDLPADAPADRARRPDDRAARSTCRWCSSTTRWRPASHSPRSRSACSRWRCWRPERRGSGARAASSGRDSACSPSGLVALIPIVPQSRLGLVPGRAR